MVMMVILLRGRSCDDDNEDNIGDVYDQGQGGEGKVDGECY